jgi:hypothetical protein
MASVELDIECGDIVLFSRNCYRMPPLPAAICVSAKMSSWTVWDHVGIVVEHPDSHELLLLEANMQGITIYPLIDRLRRTSSTAVAVRKLHRLEDTGKNIDFPRALWDTAQKYVKYQYNSSFAHMTAAAYASYTSHLSTYARLHDQLFTLKQELDYIYDYLNHEEDLAQTIAGVGGPPTTASFGDCSPAAGQAAAEKPHSILGRSLMQRAAKLVNEIESIEQTFQKLVALRQTIQQKRLPGNMTAAASPTLSPSTTNTQKASETTPRKPSKEEERFYCSQLVAQVFMDMGVLSRVHRQPHEYVPADFSSSTRIQGLLPLNHGPDHDYHQQHMQLTDDEAQKPRYYFSPDYIIPSPNTANFTVRLPTTTAVAASGTTTTDAPDASTAGTGTKVSILVQPATTVTTTKPAKIDVSTTATTTPTPTSVATLQLHTGDTIRSSILSQYLHPSASSASLVKVDIDGEVLLRPLPTIATTPPPVEPAAAAAAVESPATTAIPPSVILTGTSTQNPSSSLSLLSASTVAAARLKLKKTLESTTSSPSSSDSTDATTTSTATTHAHNDYDDDSVAMTLRAFDHHYRSDASLDNTQRGRAAADAYELLALKASKVTFHFATTPMALPPSSLQQDPTDTTVVAMTAQEQDHHQRRQRHQRLQEEKLLRWRYVESLVSLAWPTYLASQQAGGATGGGSGGGGGGASSPFTTTTTTTTGVRILPSSSIGSDAFDNDLEKWQALWQDLIAYLPPLPVSSGSPGGGSPLAGDIKSVTELRMFFAFVCFWDDTIRNLLVLLPSLLSSSSSSLTSSSSSSVFLQEMHRKAQDQRVARVLHHTAEDLADLLLHLYDVHRSPATGTAAASSSWAAHDATHLQYEHRRRVLIARIEQLLPQYLPTSPMMATSPAASNDLVLSWSPLLLMPILAATTMAASFSSPHWASREAASYRRSSAWNEPPTTVTTMLTAASRQSQQRNLWNSVRVVVAAVVRRASRW